MHFISRLFCGWRIVIVRKEEFLLMHAAIEENCNILKKPQSGDRLQEARLH